MGATLNMATSIGAYVMTDRATWLSFANRGNLEVLVEGDARLFNQYGVIAVNPSRHPRVNAAGAKAFVNWITGPDGQAAIGRYNLDGKALFFPNATR
jgi:tungstate transport system substrate-binding protein